MHADFEALRKPSLAVLCPVGERAASFTKAPLKEKGLLGGTAGMGAQEVSQEMALCAALRTLLLLPTPNQEWLLG